MFGICTNYESIVYGFGEVSKKAFEIRNWFDTKPSS